MKKLLSIVLAAAILLVCAPAAFALTDTVPAGWTPIYTPEDLDAIRDDLDGNYILMNDIDMSGWGNWEPMGSLVNGEDPDANLFFTGTIDGNGYEIKNMKIHVDNTDTAPENISMDNSMVAFVRLLSGTIMNLGFVNADVLVQGPKVHWVGGIAGMVYGDNFVNGRILNCYYEGSVIADKCNSLGALAAVLGTDAEPTLASVRNSYSVGTFMNNGTTQSSASVRAKHGDEDYDYYSWTFSGIEEQFAMDAEWKEICAEKSYNSISWDMSSCGGIAGDQYQGTATNCYTSAEQLVGVDYCAWEPVRIEQSATLTLTQMTHAANFVGFDFTDEPVWYIKEGESYPKLRPFPAPESPTYFPDPGTGVEAETDDDVFPPGTVMQVTELGAGNFVLGPGNSVHAVYDIKFIKDNEVVQPDGKVTVRLPFKDVSPGTSANWKVYYVERDTQGNITNKVNMNAKVVQIDGVYYWEFEADHFSIYAVVNEATPRFWDSWPCWAQWILKYILFGWLWMRWL